jgi:hypothetical protein
MLLGFNQLGIAISFFGATILRTMQKHIQQDLINQHVAATLPCTGCGAVDVAFSWQGFFTYFVV